MHRYRLVVAIISFILPLLLSGCTDDGGISRVTNSTDTEDIGIWCEAFLDKDYITCDNNTSISDLRIQDFYDSDEYYASELSSGIYDIVLSELSDSIISFKIEGTSTPDIVDVTVTYNPIVTPELNLLNADNLDDINILSISDLPTVVLDEVYQRELDYIANKYISGELSEFQYREKVNEIWLLEFSYYFGDYEDSISTFTVSIEVTNEGGISRLRGTSALYLTLMREQGIMDILNDFETRLSIWHRYALFSDLG